MRTFDVTDIPLVDFTLAEVDRRFKPLRYTPDVIYVTPKQHAKVMYIDLPETGRVLWKTWRGIPIKHRGELPEYER